MCRLLAGLSIGLMVATLLETSGWLAALARAGRPVCRAAHLGSMASSAFVLAVVSPSAANALLGESFDKGELGRTELLAANLLCGLPSYVAHLPTVFLLLYPVLGTAAISYVGVTFAAACMRTAAVVLWARHALPATPAESVAVSATPGHAAWRTVLAKGFSRFKKRLIKLVCYTTPVYVAIFLATKYGMFAALEHWLGTHLGWLPILNPEAAGIVLLQLVAEMGATLGAAAAVLNAGQLTSHEVVVAMLVGSVLATPLRALRHQLPSYAGFFRMGQAIRLVAVNQGLRAVSMVAALAVYMLGVR